MAPYTHVTSTGTMLFAMDTPKTHARFQHLFIPLKMFRSDGGEGVPLATENASPWAWLGPWYGSCKQIWPHTHDTHAGKLTRTYTSDQKLAYMHKYTDAHIHTPTCTQQTNTHTLIHKRIYMHNGGCTPFKSRARLHETTVQEADSEYTPALK